MMIGDAMTLFDPVLPPILLSMLKKLVLNSMLPFSKLNLSKSMLTFFDITYLYLIIPFEASGIFEAVGAGLKTG